jgi:phosphate transport system permease protein
MELIFKKLAQFSASLVFFILAATAVVLYLSAKPAIEEFGVHFLFESRWGVEEKVELSALEQSQQELLSGSIDDEDFVTLGLFMAL